MLRVKSITLTTFGAVSEQTVREMVEGALQHSQAQVAVAITGIAGPTGGTKDKPVGLVWMAWAGINQETKVLMEIFPGDRQQVREKTITISLQNLLQFIDKIKILHHINARVPLFEKACPALVAGGGC